MPVARRRELDDVIERAHAAGMQVLAADIKGDDLLAARTDGSSPGRPHGCSATRPAGLPDELLALVDRVVTVPIYGRAESMNLATAATVCLYESAFAQRRSLTAVVRVARQAGPRLRSHPASSLAECAAREAARARAD